VCPPHRAVIHGRFRKSAAAVEAKGTAAEKAIARLADDQVVLEGEVVGLEAAEAAVAEADTPDLSRPRRLPRRLPPKTIYQTRSNRPFPRTSVPYLFHSL
jgi:hypothetical protein